MRRRGKRGEKGRGKRGEKGRREREGGWREEGNKDKGEWEDD